MSKMAKLNLLLPYISAFVREGKWFSDKWFPDFCKAYKNIAPQQIELLYKIRKRKTCVGFYVSWIWALASGKVMYPTVGHM